MILCMKIVVLEQVYADVKQNEAVIIKFIQHYNVYRCTDTRNNLLSHNLKRASFFLTRFIIK